jgi:hypothetical protein
VGGKTLKKKRRAEGLNMYPTPPGNNAYPMPPVREDLLCSGREKKEEED